jgi:hypothetical protein
MKEKLNIPDKNPFKVPDNYFEEVNRKILAATTGESAAIKRGGLLLRIRPFPAIAASVAVLTLLTFTGVKIFSHGKSGLTMPDIALENYTEELVGEIDMISLEERAAAMDVTLSKPKVDYKDIVEYLILENVDINDIYELL